MAGELPPIRSSRASAPPQVDRAPPPSRTAPTGLDGALGRVLSDPATRPLITPMLGAGRSALQVFGGRAVPQGLLSVDRNLYPSAIGLDDLLAQMKPAEARQLAQTFLGTVTAKTGLAVPEGALQAVLAKPQSLSWLLQATPADLSGGLKVLQAQIKDGKVPDIKPRTYQTVSGLDLGALDGLAIQRPQTELKPLAGPLLMGSVQSELPDHQAKLNIVTAEVLDQLAQNTSKAEGRFEVVLNGHKHTRIDTFLKALIADGHTIEATVEHRAADFADLKTKVGDQILDVAAAIHVRTGIVKDGQEALVPTVHSEMVFRIRSSDQTRGTKIDADVKFYQGISATGFHPVGLTREADWCGRKISDRLNQAQSLEGMILAGLFTDVIKTSARKNGLGVEGYGLTGVCNDSVAILQHAITGRTTCHPLLMLDETLKPELLGRIADPRVPQHRALRKLLKSIEAVPNDLLLVLDAAFRARESFPWLAGRAPTEATRRSGLILA